MRHILLAVALALSLLSTPTATLAQSPLVTYAPRLSPVQGTVSLYGYCCEGTSSGTTAHAIVQFTARSRTSSVTSMRLVRQHTLLGDVTPACAPASQFAHTRWKPFVSQKTISIPPSPDNGSAIWTVSVQYRDRSGHVSPVVCIHIRVSYVDAT